MPLSFAIDKAIQDCFAALLNQAEEVVKNGNEASYYAVKIQLFSLMNYISPISSHFQQLREEINRWDRDDGTKLLGCVKGLKSSYYMGLFNKLPEIIEANVVSNYMAQAEGLLEKNYHVSAAVLAGAVLEDALHRLCQRQTPPIELVNVKGDPKSLSPLITDLQTADVFNKSKADQLNSWAKMRNYAAHGEFKQFNRQDVEDMIGGIKRFLAEYL